MQKDNGDEKCRTKQPRDLSNKGRGGQIGIGHRNDSDYDTYTLTVPNENGEHIYGPFPMPSESNHWQNDQSCAADLSVDNLEHRYQNVAPFGRIAIQFDLEEDLSLSICGVNRNGNNTCSWNIRTAGDNRRFGMRLGEFQSDYTITLRDSEGCHTSLNHVVPNDTSWTPSNNRRKTST